jgi:hypothetical protein
VIHSTTQTTSSTTKKTHTSQQNKAQNPFQMREIKIPTPHLKKQKNSQVNHNNKH